MGIRIKILKSVGLFTIAFIIAIGLFILMTNIPIWNDCYDSHFKECNNAHNNNMTFLYYSGFQVPPADSDFYSFCAFHPEEGCSEIPHGCVVYENEYLVGFRIPFTKIEWRPFAW